MHDLSRCIIAHFDVSILPNGIRIRRDPSVATMGLIYSYAKTGTPYRKTSYFYNLTLSHANGARAVTTGIQRYAYDIGHAFYDCTIEHNRNSGDTSGLYNANNNGNFYAYRCTFYDNENGAFNNRRSHFARTHGLINCTITENFTSTPAYNMVVRGVGHINMRNITIVNNDGIGFTIEGYGIIRMDNSILSDNTDGDFSVATGLHSYSWFRNCLIKGSGSSYFTDPSNITGVDPQVNPLADNGGYSDTMALKNISQCLGTGNWQYDHDQRYALRINPGMDIGAYEYWDTKPLVLRVKY